MPISLDMDIKDIVALLTKKNGGQNGVAESGDATDANSFLNNKLLIQYRKPILAVAALTLFFGAFMLGVYSPYRTSTNTMQTKLVEATDKKGQLARLDAEAGALESDIGASSEYYTELLEYFGENEDLGSLYGAVSSLAITNDLVVLNIKEVGKTHSKQKKHGTMVREAEVELALQGRFGNYMKFKQALINEKTLLRIHRENIAIISDENDPGKISVKLNLLNYTIDKKPFRDVIADAQALATEVAQK